MEAKRATRYRRAMSLTARTFGPLLREWRQRRRMSQLGLALEGNISARHLSFLETGSSQPNRDMVLHPPPPGTRRCSGNASSTNAVRPRGQLGKVIQAASESESRLQSKNLLK